MELVVYCPKALFQKDPWGRATHVTLAKNTGGFADFRQALPRATSFGKINLQGA